MLKLAKLIKSTISLLPNDSFSQLIKLGRKLSSINVFTTAIEATIDERGEIKDDASAALKTLRMESRQVDVNIKEELNRLIRSPALYSAWRSLCSTDYRQPAQLSTRHSA
jgi:dsDNA-specific endonuclease/ATPase MutS2